MTRDAMTLHGLLRRIAARVGVAAASHTAALAAAVSGVALLCWALVTAVLPVPFPLARLAVGTCVALIALFVALARRLRPSPLRAAQIADARAGLADRLGTAAELLAQPTSPLGLARMQIADAIAVSYTISPRTVAPLRLPRALWVAAGACVLLCVWARFFMGWSLPATPSAKVSQMIQREGRSISGIGRQLEAAGRSQGLPQTQRLAPKVEALGQRLESSHLDRQQALGLLRDTGRELDAAQQQLERQLDAALGQGQSGGASTQAPAPADRETPAQRLARLDAAVRQVRQLTGQLQQGGSAINPQALQSQMRALSDSLDQTNAPVSAQQSVAKARQEAAQGHATAAAGALNEAMEDLQDMEGMVGDDQMLGDASKNIQASTSRIADNAPPGGSESPPQTGTSPNAPPAQASGPNAPTAPTDEPGPPAPPGPNQGSLPGKGTGGGLGAPSPRLRASRTQEYLSGAQGQGPSTIKEIVASGQGETPRLPAGSPSPQVAREIDRAMSQAPLPPAYVTLVRDYFKTLGGTP